jgi:copper(I)-binding protein
MTGVFATISNGSDHDVILTGGSTDIAMMVQTHEVVDGMMQETENGITIPAGGSVTLEPGGLHVMLMNLKKPIVSGDKVNFTFAFDDGSEQAFELTAKVSDGGDEEYHDH